MAIDIPTTEPAQIRAGDTVTWSKSLNDYPASDGWTLYYRLINSAGNIDITTTASGSDHLVSETPATTAAWVAGDYTLISWVDDGTDRVTLPEGCITVLQNLAVAVGGVDDRSHNQKMLDAIETAIESFATGDRLAIVEAELRERKFKYDLQGLIGLRKYYQYQVRVEEDAKRIAAGKKARNKIQMRL